MEIPENCKVCPYTHSCNAAHYGASTCRYGTEINRATIARMDTKEEDIQT